MKYIIEIATSDFSTTRSAVEGGADRIELCSNLPEGGTTPSCGTILKCREAFDIPIFPIIRPRGGDFLYTDEEFSVMMTDVEYCKKIDCDGIVTGLLKADGSIDVKRTALLIQKAYPMEVTFHRAFDRCSNPFEAMEQLLEIGCVRILTSGQKPLATEGVDLIAELHRMAGHRIHIMPGSGVRKENIRSLAEQTGCAEFHSSLRGKKTSLMSFIHPEFQDVPDSYENNFIDPEEVRNLREALALVKT